MIGKPPIPEPITTPTSSAFVSSITRPASSTAIWLAAIAKWMKESLFLTSFFSIHSSGWNPFTSAAIRVTKAVVSKRVIGPTPLSPASSARQVDSVPTPSGETRPTPVTTTRRRGELMA